MEAGDEKRRQRENQHRSGDAPTGLWIDVEPLSCGPTEWWPARGYRVSTLKLCNS